MKISQAIELLATCDPDGEFQIDIPMSWFKRVGISLDDDDVIFSCEPCIDLLWDSGANPDIDRANLACIDVHKLIIENNQRADNKKQEAWKSLIQR